MPSPAQPRQMVVKKYANRRLYDTESSVYITLEDLCERVKEGRDFIVQDAKTGQDLTRQVLTQIILEREMKGSPLLPAEFLRSVIRFYDDRMQGVMQEYLTASMNAFVHNQERVRDQLKKNMAGATGQKSAPFGGGVASFKPFEYMARNNVAFMEKAFGMFSPFNNYFGSAEESSESEKRTRRTKR